MWLGSSQQLDIRDVPLLSASVTVVNTARDLGVILDSQLSLDAHVALFCLQEQLLPTEAASSSRTVTVCRSIQLPFIDSLRVGLSSPQVYLPNSD